MRDTEAMVLAVLQRQAVTFLPAAARDLCPRPGLGHVDVPELGDSESVLAWLYPSWPGCRRNGTWLPYEVAVGVGRRPGVRSATGPMAPGPGRAVNPPRCPR